MSRLKLLFNALGGVEETGGFFTHDLPLPLIGRGVNLGYARRHRKTKFGREKQHCRLPYREKTAAASMRVLWHYTLEYLRTYRYPAFLRHTDAAGDLPAIHAGMHKLRQYKVFQCSSGPGPSSSPSALCWANTTYSTDGAPQHILRRAIKWPNRTRAWLCGPQELRVTQIPWRFRRSLRIQMHIIGTAFPTRR